MANRDERITPLGQIIMARARILAAAMNPADRPARNRRLAELSYNEIAALTPPFNGGVEIAATTIGDWIHGRRGRVTPKPDKLRALAHALADRDTSGEAIYEDMRHALGRTWEPGKDTHLDLSDLTSDEQRALRSLARLLREARLAGANNTVHDREHDIDDESVDDPAG